MEFSMKTKFSFAESIGKLKVYITILWENKNQPNDQFPLRYLSVGGFLIIDVAKKIHQKN